MFSRAVRSIMLSRPSQVPVLVQTKFLEDHTACWAVSRYLLELWSAPTAAGWHTRMPSTNHELVQRGEATLYAWFACSSTRPYLWSQAKRFQLLLLSREQGQPKAHGDSRRKGAAKVARARSRVIRVQKERCDGVATVALGSVYFLAAAFFAPEGELHRHHCEPEREGNKRRQERETH